MLSSLSLGSLDNLEKLPINSLNSICDRVRQALLHVFLPRLCEKCQPTFSEAFRKTQSTPLLLKVLCEPCKINYIKDKRSVSRKKTPEKPSIDTKNNNNGALTTKYPAKKKSTIITSTQQQPSLLEVSRNNQNDRDNTISNITNNKNLTVKIKLISTISNHHHHHVNLGPINHPLPLTPPPEDEIPNLKKFNEETEELTILIDNYNDFYNDYKQIYEYLSEKNIDWCRYCGVAGDTGTFWKLGPWGDRTLCHKHGCEFFGCGFARVTKTRLDLTEFHGEKKSERKIPIISEFCSICINRKDRENEDEENNFITCHGCPLSFHKDCLQQQERLNSFNSSVFYCSQNCHENFQKCLIRPQFPSKMSFPFYRQILSISNETLDVTGSKNTDSEVENNLKLKINLKRKLEESNVITKRIKSHRKHRKQIQNDQVVVAFLPIKIDQSIHQHEIINTPQWTKKSINDRLNNLDGFNESDEFEDLNDEILLNRHARYEHVEKTTRLLKPGVLSQLISESKVK